jgi:SapC
VANIEQLNNVDHGDLRVVTGHQAAFGDAVNQTVIFPTEYVHVQREYMILIQKLGDGEGEFQSVALLGLDRDENLYLGSEGWNARYIPAMHQRGPFMIGMHEVEVNGRLEREPMIHVDLDHPRIGTNGQAVFLSQGGNSPYLNQIMGVLQTIHEGVAMMSPMFAAFNGFGLLENTAIEISISDTEHYKLDDYYVISSARFAALDGDALHQLNEHGYLEAAVAIMGSIGNAQHLIALKNRRLHQ